MGWPPSAPGQESRWHPCPPLHPYIRSVAPSVIVIAGPIVMTSRAPAFVIIDKQAGGGKASGNQATQELAGDEKTRQGARKLVWGFIIILNF